MFKEKSEAQPLRKAYQQTQRPRKKICTQLCYNEQYNEFMGEPIKTGEPIESDGQEPQQTEHQYKIFNQTEIKKQRERYKQIYQSVSNGRINSQKVSFAQCVQRQVKIQERVSDNEKKQKTSKAEDTEVKTQDRQKNKKNAQKKNPSSGQSNWQKFLASTPKADKGSEKQTNSKKSDINFVAMDCEFVKCEGEVFTLARVSIVNENLSILYDSYVKPTQKIIDYLTSISGITYRHLKNAPSQAAVIQSVKNSIFNKILIGHTIDKDLEVCGLSNWKGLKGKVDVSQSKKYSEGGKRTSLKNLSYDHLGIQIQGSWHSSVQDAQAAMRLFLKHKVPILKENNLIKQ